MADKIEMLKKLTVKACNAVPTMQQLAKLEKDGGFLPLLQIYGIAAKYKPDQSDKGPYVRFYGQFRGANLITKQVYESSVVLLPGIIENGLFAAMGPQDAPRETQFAFTVGVKFDAKAATKYVYAAESMLPPSENDPIALLERQLGTKLLAPPKS